LGRGFLNGHGSSCGGRAGRDGAAAYSTPRMISTGQGECWARV
jgi:hypothetical protein